MKLRLQQMLIGFFLILGFAVGVPSEVQGGMTNYDLAADWSDTSNPNGPWTYLAAPGVPLTSHLSDWDPNRQFFTSPQPVWAYGTYPNVGQIPLFMKVVSSMVDPRNDAPIGSVLIHDNDSYNSPSGLANQAAGFAWTAPSAGVITISGGMWEVQRYLGRSEDWALEVNGVTVSSGTLTSSSLITSSTPLDLSLGSGGTAALTQNVEAGEVVSLMFTRASGEPYGTFMGVDLSIGLNSVPEPSSLMMFMLGMIGFVGLDHRARRRIRAARQ